MTKHIKYEQWTPKLFLEKFLQSNSFESFFDDNGKPLVDLSDITFSKVNKFTYVSNFKCAKHGNVLSIFSADKKTSRPFKLRIGNLNLKLPFYKKCTCCIQDEKDKAKALKSSLTAERKQLRKERKQSKRRRVSPSISYN
jgi:hypothetical protein